MCVPGFEMTQSWSTVNDAVMSAFDERDWEILVKTVRCEDKISANEETVNESDDRFAWMEKEVDGNDDEANRSKH